MQSSPLALCLHPAADVRATLFSSSRAVRVPRTVGAGAVVATLVGVGVYCVMKKKNQPPGGGQAQGGVTLYDSESQKI